MAVPHFAKSFPKDPDLDAAVEAFQQGHYDRVRTLTAALLRRDPTDPALRSSAKELAARLDPDPLALRLLAIAAALLVLMASFFWLTAHGH